MKLTIILIFIVNLSQNYAFATPKDILNEQKVDTDLSLLAVNNDEVNTELIEQLNTRKTLVDWHVYTGWASVVLLAASFITAEKNKNSNLHNWTATAAAGLYLSSASLVFFIPNLNEKSPSRSILWHKRYAYLHVPGMLATILSGFIAHEQHQQGKKLSGLGKFHKGISQATMIPFILSIGVTLYEF